jgi:hypothetical protein
MPFVSFAEFFQDSSGGGGSFTNDTHSIYLILRENRKSSCFLLPSCRRGTREKHGATRQHIFTPFHISLVLLNHVQRINESINDHTIIRSSDGCHHRTPTHFALFPALSSSSRSRQYGPGGSPWSVLLAPGSLATHLCPSTTAPAGSAFHLY